MMTERKLSHTAKGALWLAFFAMCFGGLMFLATGGC
jgi:hypothetical protein